jgi:cyclic dehypoxanthinyl futalosine synthase
MRLGIAQIALSAGADDIGSTMMEENVVSASGTMKTMASVEELKDSIIDSGFTPALRDSEYNLLNLFGVKEAALEV